MDSFLLWIMFCFSAKGMHLNFYSVFYSYGKIRDVGILSVLNIENWREGLG